MSTIFCPCEQKRLEEENWVELNLENYFESFSRGDDWGLCPHSPHLSDTFTCPFSLDAPHFLSCYVPAPNTSWHRLSPNTCQQLLLIICINFCTHLAFVHLPHKTASSTWAGISVCFVHFCIPSAYLAWCWVHSRCLINTYSVRDCMPLGESSLITGMRSSGLSLKEAVFLSCSCPPN